MATAREGPGGWPGLAFTGLAVLVFSSHMVSAGILHTPSAVEEGSLSHLPLGPRMAAPLLPTDTHMCRAPGQVGEMQCKTA